MAVPMKSSLHVKVKPAIVGGAAWITLQKAAMAARYLKPDTITLNHSSLKFAWEQVERLKGRPHEIGDLKVGKR